MESSPFASLPDELIELIVLHLPPRDTVSFGGACKRGNKITFEPLVWRRHCVQTWKYWERVHELAEKVATPPAQTRWRAVFEQRQATDHQAERLFDSCKINSTAAREKSTVLFVILDPTSVDPEPEDDDAGGASVGTLPPE